MGQTLKKRDFSFDAIRGFCMFLVPFQHYMSAQEGFNYDGLEGYIYFITDVFIMQVFFFLSGYFSKKPERGREIAVKALLWPIIVVQAGLFVLTLIGFDLTLYPYRPPYAMWFLLSLFYFRMFHKDYIKIPHIFGIVFVLGLFVGMVPFLTRDFAISRSISWMPYFLLGYYCQPAHIEKIRSLKLWQTLSILAGLLAGIWAFMKYVPFDAYWAVMMATTNEIQEITWYENIIMHIALLPVSMLFLVVLLNLFKHSQDKFGFWAWIGQNTMPIYIFHLAGKFIIIHYGASAGLFPLPAHDTWLYILYLLALAFATSVILASKPFAWLYDVGFVKSYDWFCTICRVVLQAVGKGAEKVMCAFLPGSLKEIPATKPVVKTSAAQQEE